MAHRFTLFARALAAFVLGASLAGVGPAPVLAQDDAARAQAREHFGRGVERYAAGNYRGALEEFQEAYRLAPHPTVRVNMANCYEHLDRPLEALHHFERFLAESESPSPQQRSEVQAAMRRLERLIGEVRFAVAPDGAEITIDESETRRAPLLEPVRLVRGTHQVIIRMDGFRSVRREVTVRGGDTQRVSVRLEPGEDDPSALATSIPARADPPPEDQTSDPPPDGTNDGSSTGDGTPPPNDTYTGGGGGWRFRLTAPVIIAGSATIAFGLATLICGIVALDANSQFENAVDRVRIAMRAGNSALVAQAQADGRAAADLANTMSILTDVFLIGTILSAGLTVVFIVLEGFGGDEESAGNRPAGPRIGLAPSASPDGGGLSLFGTF